MNHFFLKPATHYGVRSVSFPAARSHPSTLKILEELNKLRSWMGSSSPKAEEICTGLSRLADVYTCMGEFLNLPLTQQALAQHHHQKWVDELLDGSIRYLDICGSSRDAISLTKESARELQSALRRSKGGDLSIESNINAYVSSRKNMKKETAKSLESLKQMDNYLAGFPSFEQNPHLSTVAGMLRETGLITISIFRSLLLFLSPSLSKPKPVRWSLVSKLVRKGLASSACEGQQDVNELESVDVAVSNLPLQNAKEDGEAEKTQNSHMRLEVMDAILEDFEDGLELLFRCLINCRVSLLNILSDH